MAGPTARSNRQPADVSTPVKERVARHLRHLIERRRLRPGDRLPTERQLAVELGVSRPSVRSALQSLAAIGVVRSRRRAGTFIEQGPPSLDSEPLSLLAALHDFTSEDIFEARAALEVVAAGLAARRAGPQQRTMMAEELAGMFASLGEPQSFLVHDLRFHRAVAAGSHNPVVAALVDMVAALVFDRHRSTVARARDLRRAAETHQRIYQAIRRQSPAQARAAMAHHLRRALEGWAAEDRMASSPGAGLEAPARGRRSRSAGGSEGARPEAG